MNMEKFWVEFKEDPKQRELRELAKAYHDVTEAYDKAVCSGVCERSGCAIPVYPIERTLSSQYTAQVLKSVVSIGELKGFTPKEVRAAIRNYKSDQ